MNAASQETYALFKRRYEEQSGEVHLADSPTEAAAIVGRIISKFKLKKGVLAALPKDLREPLLEHLTQQRFPVISIQRSELNVPEQINEADLGIGAARFGIAETGTIVEVSRDDRERLISSLPLVHVAFLKAKAILPALQDASAPLRKIYVDSQKPTNITFISGPSRTADIEMKLFLGVHGPKASHVVVCDW